MTASKKPSNTKKEAPALPGVFLLLQKTFTLYRQYSGFFFGYLAWLLIPIVFTVIAANIPDQEISELLALMFGFVLYVVISILLTVIFIKSTPFLYTKKPISVELVRMAAVLTLPYLVTLLVTNLATLSGLILFIVPGLIIGTWLAFAPTIAVIEQTTIIESLKASKKLVEGRFLDVFLRYAGGHILIIGGYFACILTIMYVSFSIQGAGDLEAFIQSPLTLGEDIALRFIDLFFLPLAPIFTTLLYMELKQR